MFRSIRRKLMGYEFVFVMGVVLGLFIQTGDIKDAIASVTPNQKPVVVTATPAVLSSVTGLRITRVIDGDTFELSTGEKVRMIGVNTPETHHPTKGVECYGKEAETYSRQLLEGKQVRLEKDVSNTDKYGRLLRLVYLQPESSTEAELFVNKNLVQEGYAMVSTFPPDVAFKDEFLAAQQEARLAGKGLWGMCGVK